MLQKWLVCFLVCAMGCTKKAEFQSNPDMNLLLSRALESPHIEEDLHIIQELLDQGADPNGFYYVKGVPREPFLFIAIRKQSIPLMQTLIQFGADPNQSFEPYENALAYAVMHVQKPIIFDALLKLHAAIPKRLPSGQSVLAELLELNNLEVALLFVQAGMEFENEAEKGQLVCALLKQGSEAYLWFWLKNNPNEIHYRFPQGICDTYQSQSLFEIAQQDSSKTMLRAALSQLGGVNGL